MPSKAEKAVAAAKKEGGKKGQDLIGMCEMGGMYFHNVLLEMVNAKWDLMQNALEGMNAEVDDKAEDRKGGAGKLGKILYSCDKEFNKLIVLCHVPAETAKEKEFDAKAWFTAVTSAIGVTEFETDGDVMKFEVTKDAEAGRFPQKLVDQAMSAGFQYLREKGLMMDDDDEDLDYGELAEAAGIEW